MTCCPHCGSVLSDTGFGDECLTFDLAPRHYKILQALIAARGEPVPVERLIHAVYGDNPDGGPLYADAIIRHGIRDLKYHVWAKGYEIKAKPGRGYRIFRMPPSGIAVSAAPAA